MCNYVGWFVAILLKYRILFKGLTFLGLDYRDASLILVYLVVLGISIPKIRYNKDIKDNYIIYKICCQKS